MVLKIIKRLFTLFILYKKKPASKQLINFSHNKFWSQFFVFTVMGLVILVLLSIWGANFLERIVNPVKYVTNSQAIVEIYPEVSSDQTRAKQQIVLDYLQNNPNIARVNVVSPKEMQALLKSWISVLNDTSNLPLPIIMNVDLKTGSTLTASDLQLALSQKVKDVYVESDKSLAARLTGTINVSRGLILFIPFILFFILFGLVFFVTLGLVYAHKRTIEIISFLGASYLEIAKEFSIWIFKRALKGVLVGLGLALVIVEVFIVSLHFGWIIIPSSTTLLLMLMVIVIIPIEVTIITFFLVRRIINWMI